MRDGSCTRPRAQSVAVNGTINSVSRLIGPAVAGGLIATVGVTVGFYITLPRI